MEEVSSLGWEGSVRQLNCPASSATCILDSLFIVEANLGVNKVNYYLKRDLVSQLEIDSQGRIKRRLQINYLNASSSGAVWGGDYKNYLRLYLPLGTQLQQVTVGGEILADDLIDQGVSAGKAYFGFLVEAPYGEQLTVKVDYQLADKLLTGVTDYFFLVQKQSGADSSPFTFQLSLPSEKQVLISQPSLTGDGIFQEDQFKQDFLFRAKIR
jgi:hypothetical protein